jgi:hypothetical protein
MGTRSIHRQSVAAGVSPAVEPGVSPGGPPSATNPKPEPSTAAPHIPLLPQGEGRHEGVLIRFIDRPIPQPRTGRKSGSPRREPWGQGPKETQSPGGAIRNAVPGLPLTPRFVAAGVPPPVEPGVPPGGLPGARNPLTNAMTPAAHILLLPLGEGRDEGCVIPGPESRSHP